MISDVLKLHGIQSKAKYVEYGYSQVEPNHLSAQRTGQIYAQLPAAADIDVLENGQFACYDYATGLVQLPGKVGTGISGANYELEPMLVFNEIKLYREHQLDCEFAMVKDNYNARIYSPLDPDTLNWTKQSRYYNGTDAAGNTSITTIAPTYEDAGATFVAGTDYYTKNADGDYVKAEGLTEFAENTDYYVLADAGISYPIDDVTAGPDIYELHYNEEPWHIESRTKGKKMPENTTMVPRLFKTNVGDHFTTNGILEADDPDNNVVLKVGDSLKVDKDTGFLSRATQKPVSGMEWQVVKVYTLPDRQKAVKVLRIK